MCLHINTSFCLDEGLLVFWKGSLHHCILASAAEPLQLPPPPLHHLRPNWAQCTFWPLPPGLLQLPLLPSIATIDAGPCIAPAAGLTATSSLCFCHQAQRGSQHLLPGLLQLHLPALLQLGLVRLPVIDPAHHHHHHCHSREGGR